jgi:hypothetical protein
MLGPQGSQFKLSAARSLQLQFARILTNGSNPTINGTATGNVNNLLYIPTVAALTQAGCGGASGSAISLSGGGTLSVIGDVVSSGAITVSSSALRFVARPCRRHEVWIPLHRSQLPAAGSRRRRADCERKHSRTLARNLRRQPQLQHRFVLVSQQRRV